MEAACFFFTFTFTMTGDNGYSIFFPWIEEARQTDTMSILLSSYIETVQREAMVMAMTVIATNSPVSFPYALHPACWKQVVSGSLNIIVERR